MPYVTNQLTAAAASVVGTPTPTRSWQWLRGSTLISGATSSTYTVADADIGSAISVRQIESNIAGVATATSAATAAVQAFEPIALFQSGEEGAWYDPSDLTTLYQDSAGATPVTGTGQPVGLMLDKSKGGLQAEEITNGGFDIATGWTAVNGTLTISGGTATLAGANQNDPYFVSPAFPVTGGSWYRISIDIISSGGSPTNVNYIRLRSPGSFTGAVGIISNTALPVGTKTAIVQIPAGWTQAELAVQRGGALIPPTTTLVVDNASVKELPGNHATQSTSTARPTLSARVNLITYSEQLNSNDWAKYAVAVSADAGVAPDSTTTADLLYATSTGAVRSLYRGGLPAVSKRHRYYAKASGKDWFCILAETTAAGGVWFDVANGVLGTVSAGWTGSIESAGNGWYVCTATSTASFSTYTAIGPVDADNSTTVTVSGTDGILVWGADVRTAATSSALPAYQQITDAATYDTVGFPHYLEFVADDLMQTAAFASPLAQPNFISLAGLLPDSTSVSALVFDGLAAGSRHYAYANKNSTAFLVGTDGGSYSGTEPDGTSTNVWSFNFDGASSYLRQDGTQVATGNTGATTFGGLTLMGNINSAASPHTTNMHGFVLVNRTLTAAEIEATETYLASKSGVTLP